MKIDINNILSSYMKEIIKESSSRFFFNNDIVQNVYKRLAFIDFISINYPLFQQSFIDSSLIRSLQVYLIMSSSDSLGAGSKYFSFFDFINSNKMKEYFTNEENKKKANDDLRQFIIQVNDEYKKVQSVKQSFYNFLEWKK